MQMAIYYLLILEGDIRYVYVDDGIEFVLDNDELVIENAIAFDFNDNDVTVDNHVGLVIDNAVAIDFNNDNDVTVDNHVSLLIDNAFDFALADEEFAYDIVDSNMIDLKPCEVTYDNNGNIINVELCDYDVDESDYEGSMQDEDGNEVKVELHKVLVETGDVIYVKLHVEPKYKPTLLTCRFRPFPSPAPQPKKMNKILGFRDV